MSESVSQFITIDVDHQRDALLQCSMVTLGFKENLAYFVILRRGIA